MFDDESIMTRMVICKNREASTDIFSFLEEAVDAWNSGEIER